MSWYYVSVLTVLDDGTILERAGKVEVQTTAEAMEKVRMVMPLDCFTSVMTITKFKPELQVEIVEDEGNALGLEDKSGDSRIIPH